MKEKIGIGIITCNREDFFKKCYNSIPNYINELIIINDGKDLSFIPDKGFLVQGNEGKQVGESKNIAMRYLLDTSCDYIFTIEDDIVIKDSDIFKKYIESYKETGIHHFNFGFSNLENLDFNKKPLYRKVVEYKNCKIVLTRNILGALTFYTRESLQTIGLHHFAFNKGHGDHPELTYRAYKHGYTTPFWWFADIYGSWDMIENLSNMGSDSVVRNQDKYIENINESAYIFQMLHGHHTMDVYEPSEEEVIKVLKSLKKKVKK
jgi:hypothetical protein